MNNKPLTPAGSVALMTSGVIDFLIGSVLLGSRFGVLPWNFTEMFGIPEIGILLIGAVLALSGLGVIAFAISRQNNAPME